MNETESKRLLSLDALRGLDMLMITGLGPLLISLCVALGFGENCWLATQLHHVPWEGFQIEDGIFPLFLFIAGVSFPFSYARQCEKGVTTGRAVARILRRGLTLFFLGLVTQGFFKLQFATLRIPSVLGLIGLSWALAALLYVFCRNLWVRIVVCAAVLLGYASFMFFVQAPDFPEAARFSAEGNVICWLDRVLTAGHNYQPHFDPEGLPRILTGLVTASLGVFAGELVRRPSPSGGRKTVVMIALGAVLSVLGWLMDVTGFCPCNKALWSPSFVLLVGGYSFVLFSLFYWVIDVKGFRRWTFFFRVVGMNSITIYVARCFVPFGSIAKFFLGDSKVGVTALLPSSWQAVAVHAGYIAAAWLFLYFLYRKNTFLKV